MTEYATGTNKELVYAYKHVSQEVINDGFIYDYGCNATIEFDGSTVVRIYYDRQSYTLRYETSGGWLTINQFAHGQTIDLTALSTIPEKYGYRFVGWDADGDGVVDETMIMPQKDTFIYPVWEAVDGIAYRIYHMVQNANNDNYTVKATTYGYGVTETIPDARDIYDSKYIEDGKFVANYEKAKVVPIIEEIVGKEVTFRSSSTDCNIPLSLGVAALCIGTNIHANVHTREEWVDKESMKPGLLITIKTSMSVSGVEL